MKFSRKFEDVQAVRGQLPLSIGIIGPSGGGKTFSALRLAKGMQEVMGGEIGVIDSEQRRALHYAEKFAFRHVSFDPPYSPLDYLAAFEHLMSKGVKHIVVDSMSHEHEGPGGVLEMHDEILGRMAGTDYAKRNKMTFAAWAEPKQQRRQLAQALIRIDCNVIMCFRAKEKLKPVPGQAPQSIGWQPIGGDGFVYEMTARFLLMPGANGYPTLRGETPSEAAMIKLPDQFRPLFAEPRQLSEEVGRKMAEWARGGAVHRGSESDVLVLRFGEAASREALEAAKEHMATVWAQVPKGAERSRVTAAFKAAEARVQAAIAPPVSEDEAAEIRREEQNPAD